MDYSGRAAPQDDRDQILVQGRGLIAQSSPVMTNINILIGGTAYYTAVGLRAGDLINNICLMILVAGAAMTRSRVGLYDKNGNLLAQSADQGSSWQSINLKVIPLTAPYLVTASDIYYVGMIGAGGTLPQVCRSAATSFLSTSIGTGKALFYYQLAQSDLPSPATFADNATNVGIQWWYGFN